MQVVTMRGTILTAVSAVLTLSVIGNAYFQKKQFYPLTVYITKSNPSLAVIYCQAAILVVLAAKLMCKIFFGRLRAAELEHLIERSWFAVTETCLAFTVFRDDFSPKFVALFTLLLVIKAFHWLTEDRVDFIERSPVISVLFHVRVIALIGSLGFLNCYSVHHAYLSTVTKGATVQLVFGFEYAILFTILVNIFIKYVLHAVDLQSENPWENKAVYLLYTEFIICFVKVVLYTAFMVIMLKIHTFPLFAIRPMYLSLRSWKKSFSDIIMSRRAIRNMNLLYPDATAEELAATDNVCIICREEMTSSLSKKLPCNHIFHASCLRSWFQRQQTCPTCRMNVLRNVPAQTAAPANAQPPQQPQQQQPQQQAPNAQPLMPNLGGLLFGGGIAAQFPIWPHARPGPNGPAVPPPAAAAAAPAGPTPAPNQEGSGGASASTDQQPNTAMPPLPPFLPPPFLPIMFPPPPMPPASFNGFSDDDIRRMEGEQRENVEARIQSLRNIQILLDAAVLQMQQYSALVSSIRTSGDYHTQHQPSNTSSSHHTQSSSVASTTTTEPSPSSSSAGTTVTDSSGRTGAKPKVYCPAPKPFTTNMPSAPSPPPSIPTSSTTLFDENQNGATVSDAVVEEETSEQAEVRRRRLEKFTGASKKDNLDLD